MVPRLLLEQREMFRTTILPLSLAAIALAGCAEMRFAHTRQRAAQPYQVASINKSAYYTSGDYQTITREEAMRAPLKQLEIERETRQGSNIRQLSQHQCDALMHKLPKSAVLGNWSYIGHPAPPTNPYFTPQEQYCQALGRSSEGTADTSFPGFMPDGAWSTYDGNGHYTIHYR